MGGDESFRADVRPSGAGLRGRAERAWAEHQKAEEEGAEERAEVEARLLLAKLVELGAAPHSVRIVRAGARVSAEVEGLRFISTYSDPTLRKLGYDDEPEEHGVVLLKNCPRCGWEMKGGVVRTPEDMGRELEQLSAIRAHRCRAGAATDDPASDHAARRE
ncbi:MAG: hypothetical protein LC672_00010 [Acidobacteria bacterium]|nr:hypothetical protein [Acidobacteriota bacterium]